MSAIQCEEVRIRNFRSLRSVSSTLGQITLLVGPNNAGKTNFLEAIAKAIGDGPTFLDDEDIYKAPDEREPPKEREVTVSLRIRPEDGLRFGGGWPKHWGTAIVVTPGGQEEVYIRWKASWDHRKADFNLDRQFLAEWPENIDEMGAATPRGPASMRHVKPLSFILQSAQRDIYSDIRTRGSFWSRLLREVDVPDELRTEVETQLSGLNDKIIQGSDLLTSFENSIGFLSSSLGSSEDSVKIASVKQTVRELRKSVDLVYRNHGSSFFSMARHGMGTRSIASLVAYHGYVNWRKSKTKAGVYQPFLGLEEPEAHLHPHAQRALMGQIQSLEGQKVVSTHSTEICRLAQLSELRHFRLKDGETMISDLSLTAASLQPKEKEHLLRRVREQHLEILFAEALILFEGQTESIAFPIYARNWWKANPRIEGTTFAHVGGDGYKPFIALAEAIGVPWFVFSDGEPTVLPGVENQVKKIAGEAAVQEKLVAIPNGLSYESYLLDEGYQSAIEEAINALESRADFVDNYVKTMHGQTKTGNERRDYEGEDGRRRAVLDILTGKGAKTRYAAAVAEAISQQDSLPRVPSRIADLFVRIDAAWGSKKSEPPTGDEEE